MLVAGIDNPAKIQRGKWQSRKDGVMRRRCRLTWEHRLLFVQSVGKEAEWLRGVWMMTSISTKTVLAVAVLAGLSTCAFAQGAAPTPWELKQDMGYAYGKDGKTLSYKTGTTTMPARCLKGAKKVWGTLFFVGENGQVDVRTSLISRTRQVQARLEFERCLP